MRKRRQSLLKNYTTAGSTKLVAKSNSSNDKRKWDQKGPPNKKARTGPPKGPPRARINGNSNGNGESIINATAIGAPGAGKNRASSNGKGRVPPAYALAKKKYETFWELHSKLQKQDPSVQTDWAKSGL